MRLLAPLSSLASLTTVALLALACGNSTAPADTHPAAGDDDDDDASTTRDASSGDDDSAATDAGTIDGEPLTGDTSTGPTIDGGEEVVCSGTASCGDDACIADYATAQVAGNWCRFAGVAKNVTEYDAVCSGYHVVKITTGVVGALTLAYYDVTSGALVAILHQSLETQKSCTGSPAEVSSSPCGDNAGTTTTLAAACTD